jgi:dUTP pyrophosphatase
MIDGLTVLNAPETIDSDYRDELRVLLVNHGWRWTVIGGCIAQLVIAPIAMLDAVEVGQP